jgi:hypothetical protein
MGKSEWVSANEAAEIASAKNGRTVIPQYIRDLAQKHKIKYRALDGRTNEYLRSDVERIKVRKNKTAKTETPIAEKVETPPTQQTMPYETSQLEGPLLPIVAPKRDTLPKFEALPVGTLKIAEFESMYRLNDTKLRLWIRDGIGADTLAYHQYMSSTSRPSYCFTSEDIEHNLAVLRKHSKL